VVFFAPYHPGQRQVLQLAKKYMADIFFFKKHLVGKYPTNNLQLTILQI